MPEFKSKVVEDNILSFEQGINGGVLPILLPKNQLAWAVNSTVRGTFITHRPAYQRITLDFANDAALQSAFEKNRFQGAGYFHPDTGDDSIIAAVSGRAFQFAINANTATVTERTITGDPNPAGQPQAWLWQSEKWMIWNDGLSAPVFIDETTARRSNVTAKVAGLLTAETTLTGPSPYTITIDRPLPAFTDNPTTVYLGFRGQSVGTATDAFEFLVATSQIGLTTIQVTRATNIGTDSWVFPAGEPLFFAEPPLELPAGRMGCYGMGRNWVCLPDGRSFIASDIVGGPSGTVEYNFRDAVLAVTENTYLAGGGNFFVPGNVGDIRAMGFSSLLDVSMGQGPLQILTPTTVFTCSAPVYRISWQDVTNPILTQSLISNGALSQWSTVVANGDTLFRSVEGTRSLILGRRDFSTWGNVPISREVDRVLKLDDKALLGYSSAAVFNNRHIMTTTPTTSDQGIYHRGAVVINFDPISTLRGKAPSVYDGFWTGLNVLQYVTGLFDGIERCFAFCLNTTKESIELWEIQKDDDAYLDRGVQPITWGFETPAMLRQEREKSTPEWKTLTDGQIFVDNMLGRVHFQVYYKPDQYPCWTLWHEWDECAPEVTEDGDTAKPQYRPGMGLGTPDVTPCNVSTKIPLRNGYYFQFKVVITGHCRFLGMQVKANVAPEPSYAPMTCDPICSGETA